MDDYQIFKGSAQLDEVLKRVQQDKPHDGDYTIRLIMEQAGLDLEEEVTKGNDEVREQRMLDMNDASLTLTRKIAERWTQKKYEILFQADGQQFVTFVKDQDAKALVPLEERSKGFQWFFSFDMKFMCETNGEFKNTVIRRHVTGDWGELDEHDRQENELSLREGYRLLSAYRDRSGVKFWIVVRRDRRSSIAG